MRVKKSLQLQLGVLLVAGIMITGYSQPAIIPAPAQYVPATGQFLLNSQTKIVVYNSHQAALMPMAQWLQQRLRASGVLCGIYKESEGSPAIRLLLNDKADSKLGKEGYTLEVKENRVTVGANEPAGLFYGLQSFFQLLPTEFAAQASAPASYTLAACHVTDYPRFSWRGLMLDVSRHFFTPAEVMQYIDLMAHYKLNVLHWHLTDDQGWRIEIKSLPRLTEIGACRVPRYGTFGERLPPNPGEKATDCGYYTHEDIKTIVAYAAARFVTIVPEIDVPGHSLAAIAAYPELSVTGQPQMVSPGHKFSEWYANGSFKMLLDNTLNPADEKVYSFLDKVFTEVAALFPGQYIHAGGDECYHGYWEQSPAVQQFMKKQGIKDVHGLQSYFMTRVGKIIESKGKNMIGWDEILEGGLAPGAAVMSWRGMEGGLQAAKKGHKGGMGPKSHAYLDYMQADASLEPRIYAKLLLKQCYSFEPVPAGVNAALIMGGQGNLWTEKVPTLRHATYMTYPRAWALAEVFWSPAEQRNWPGFVQRTEAHFVRAEAAGILVSKALYDVQVSSKTQGNALQVLLDCDHPQAIIHYTIDGSFPDSWSPRYTGPITLPDGPIVLRTTSFINGRQAGRMLTLSRDELSKRK